jgi:hypothetical protein
MRAALQTELHVLGWEWKWALRPQVEARGRREAALLQIPRDDGRQWTRRHPFFELAYLEVKVETKEATYGDIADFVILTPADPRSTRKVRKWSDYIDYWADWNFRTTPHAGLGDHRTPKTHQPRLIRMPTQAPRRCPALVSGRHLCNHLGLRRRCDGMLQLPR